MDYFRRILLFVPLLAYFFHLLLVFESHCSAQTVSLFTRFNDIVLAGESISLTCSVSNTIPLPEDDITIMITDETGQELTSGSAGLDNATVYTELTSPYKISTNQTFFCDVIWVDFSASTNLSISTLPIERTHCTTNYTDGIIVGQTVTLTCYSSTSMVSSISWSSDSDITFDQTTDFVRTMTQYNRINVQPSLGQSGTVFTCKRTRMSQVTDIDRCTVGPINVYEKLNIFIHPIFTTNDPAILYPGQAQNYTCSSLPTSSVQWSIPEGLNNSGVEVSIVGSTIIVTVASDSSYTGNVTLNCSGTILTESSIANLTLVINPMESKTSTPATEIVSLKPDEPKIESLLFIVIGASGGLIAIVIVLILCCVCLKCKGNTSSTIKPDPDKLAAIPVPEYDLAPFGSGERQAVPKADVTENKTHGNDPTAAEDGLEMYTVVGKSGNENEVQKRASGALLPPSSAKTETPVTSHQGQVNGGFMESDGAHMEDQFVEEDYSTIKKDRMSVIYTAPDKKRQDVVDNSQNEEIEETDTTPSYAVVNKSRRIVIDEDMLDDEDDEDDDLHDDDVYWEA
ncbi:hypothetical protein BSL78_16676 [Apostichopus japonicus]|uniref:Ig-like domain-containing protein n=1 Tax=Stichopus japonicus TaxID=307972 RepID=A0A2G8KEN6_STIJA|nr:hypothetical protein BSL78_16676 [Apostichopus japonicus]